MLDENAGLAENQGVAAKSEEQAPNRSTEVEGGSSRQDGGQQENGHRGGRDPWEAQKRVTADFKKRFDKLEATLTEIAQRSQSPQAQPQAPVSQTPQDTGFWGGPESYVDQRSTENAQKVFFQMQYQQANENAMQKVLSQEFIDPEADKGYLDKMIVDHGLTAAWHADPTRTAETLIKLVKLDRGIGGNGNAALKSQVRSVQGSPVSNKGVRTWSKREIKAMSLSEFNKNEDDILAAKKEGRITD